MSLLKVSEFDSSKITYSDVRPMGPNAKQVYINYDDSQVVFATPRLKVPFGLSKFEQEGQNPKYSLDLSFGDLGNEKNKVFFDAIKSIDEKVLADATKNSLIWLRKRNVSEEVIETLFSPSVKYSKDKVTGEVNTNYPPTIRAKLPYYNGEFSCSVYDHDRKKLDEFADKITKGSRVIAVIKCAGVWLAGGKFGSTWRVEQLKLDKPNSLQGFAFVDEDDED